MKNVATTALILLGVFVAGFLACYFLVKQPAGEVVYSIPDWEVLRKLTDPEGIFPYLIVKQGPAGLSETTYVDSTTPLSAIPDSTYATVDSLPFYLDRDRYWRRFGLEITFKGILYSYRLISEADTFRHKIPAPSNWSAFLYLAGAFDEGLSFHDAEVGSFVFYRRVGVMGRVEFLPVRREDNTLQIEPKFVFGACAKIL